MHKGAAAGSVIIGYMLQNEMSVLSFAGKQMKSCTTNVYIYTYIYTYIHTYMHTFLDVYCSTVQDLLDWFEVDLGFTELSLRGGGLGSSTIFKKFHETYAPS